MQYIYIYTCIYIYIYIIYLRNHLCKFTYWISRHKHTDDLTNYLSQIPKTTDKSQLVA